jgi:hypothetical protein
MMEEEEREVVVAESIEKKKRRTERYIRLESWVVDPQAEGDVNAGPSLPMVINKGACVCAS